MSESLVVSGGLLAGQIDSGPLDLRVADGVVAEIGPMGSLVDKGQVLEATDALVLPGFVDIQVHFRTPGGEESEDISSGAAGAALAAHCRRERT